MVSFFVKMAPTKKSVLDLSPMLKAGTSRQGGSLKSPKIPFSFGNPRWNPCANCWAAIRIFGKKICCCALLNAALDPFAVRMTL